jgi:hypothetical protein
MEQKGMWNEKNKKISNGIYCSEEKIKTVSIKSLFHKNFFAIKGVLFAILT